jgi:hypothetical protein
MIYRERIRTWKTKVSELIALTATVTGKAELVETVTEYVDTLLDMVLHKEGAYDLFDKAEKSKADVEESQIEQYFDLLDRIPDA